MRLLNRLFSRKGSPDNATLAQSAGENKQQVDLAVSSLETMLKDTKIIKNIASELRLRGTYTVETKRNHYTLSIIKTEKEEKEKTIHVIRTPRSLSDVAIPLFTVDMLGLLWCRFIAAIDPSFSTQNYRQTKMILDVFKEIKNQQSNKVIKKKIHNDKKEILWQGWLSLTDFVSEKHNNQDELPAQRPVVQQGSFVTQNMAVFKSKKRNPGAR